MGLAQGQSAEVRHPGRAVTALGVVETEVAGQTCPKLGGRFVGTQVHVLVRDAAPQTLDEPPQLSD